MEAVETIRVRAGAAPVAVGLVLGSGLGHLAGTVDGVAIDYADLPGFPRASVSGHQPKLVIGDLEGVRVAVFGGRAHYYERGDPAAMRAPLETLAPSAPSGCSSPTPPARSAPTCRPAS